MGTTRTRSISQIDMIKTWVFKGAEKLLLVKCNENKKVYATLQLGHL